MSPSRQSITISGRSRLLLALLLSSLAIAVLPAAGRAGQTSDPAHPAFAGATVVPLDDSFLDVEAIAGANDFVITVDGVEFAFTATAPFSFLCVGPAGAPPCLLASFGGSIHVAVGGPVEALGFVLHFSEGELTADFQGTAGSEAIVFPPGSLDLFGGAFGIGDVLSVDFSPASVWRAMHFVPSAGGPIGCQLDPSLCDDGDLCTVGECLADGTCQFTAIDCEDGNPCTIDSCDPFLGCQHDPIPDCCEPELCAPNLQTCDDAGLCADPDFASGLDLVDVDLLTDSGEPPAVGEPFGVELSVPLVEGEPQYAGIDLILADPFEVTLRPETFPVLGDLELVTADPPVQVVLQILALDPESGSVFLDLDGDLVLSPDEPVALIRSGSVLVNISLPFGGDYDPEEHFFASDGLVTLTLEPIFSVPAPGGHNVRVIVSSVDPDTGGPSDGAGVSPRLLLRDFSLQVGLAIDIKPDSSENSVNPGSDGVIPVAILSTDSFAATAAVDPLSAAFGPGGAPEAHGQGHAEDVDGDGDDDLLLHFRTQESGIQCGDSTAGLTAETFSGEALLGADSIQTVGCQ